MRIGVLNDARLIRRLKALPLALRAEARGKLERAGEKVRNRMVEGIKNGPKTGRLYTHRFPYVFGQENPPASHRRPPHRASAQDEYPAADTGNLMRSIHLEIEGAPEIDGAAQLALDLGEFWEGRLAAAIGVAADYAAPLEFKPPEKGGRPFARRALAESEDDVAAEFATWRGFDPGSVP